MKTLKSIIFFVTVFAISAGFFACGDDPPPPVASLIPAVSWQSPTNPNFQVDRYEPINFNFTASSNTNTQKKLKTIKMVATYSWNTVTDILMDSLAEVSSKQIEFVYTVPGDAPWGQVITITVTVEDAGQQKNTKVFKFTVTNLSDLNYFDVWMGAQSNITLGSYFASDSGQVWTSTVARSNQSRVDIIYFYDDVLMNGNCIAAPSSLELYNATTLVSAWSTKNNTLFKQVVIADTIEYNKIRSYVAIQQLYNGGTGTGTNYFPTITDGGGGLQPTYLAFKTKANKYGILRVVDLTNGTPQTRSSVHLNIKVQK